jgi:hypothetical protein
MTRPLPLRPPSWAVFQAPATSPPLLTTLCPLPDELITGLTTHGVPIAASGGKKSSGAEVYKVGRRGSVYAHIVLIL